MLIHDLKFMIFISIVNISIICYVYTNVKYFEMKLFILAAIYIIVNSKRSTFGFVKIILKYVYLILQCQVHYLEELITTFSELAFVALIKLILKEIIKKVILPSNLPLNLTLNIVFFMIIIAEICCWAGCLSYNQHWNMLEESIWTLSSVIISVIMLILYLNTKNKFFERFLFVGILISVIYQYL